jgi:hypothetical protein
MSTLAHIVIADEADVEAIGESAKPVDDWQGFAVRGLDSAKFAMLHALLTEETFEEASAHYEPLYAASDEGPWVIRLADAPMELLARMDEEVLERVAEELAATEEFEMDNWPAEEVQAVLSDLASLADDALAEGHALFVWLKAD